jgi:hypothetical protein
VATASDALSDFHPLLSPCHSSSLAFLHLAPNTASSTSHLARRPIHCQWRIARFTASHTPQFHCQRRIAQITASSTSLDALPATLRTQHSAFYFSLPVSDFASSARFLSSYVFLSLHALSHCQRAGFHVILFLVLCTTFHIHAYHGRTSRRSQPPGLCLTFSRLHL